MTKSNSKSIIAVDMDDVLTPHHKGLIEWFNKTYRTKLTVENYHGFDPEPWGTQSIEEAIKRVHKYFESDEFKAEQPYAESNDVLKHLAERFSLIVVTGRDHMIEETTQEWLKVHHPGLFEAVHFTAQYNLDGNSRSKADLVHSENITYLIDDSLSNLLEVAAEGARGVLFGDYPWNVSENLPNGIVRCRDWQAVKEYFDGLQ